MISDPRKFVRTWLTKNKVTIDERGGLQSGDNRDNIEIFDTMFLDYNEQITYFNYKADKKIKAVPEGHLQKALQELIALHVLEERKKLFARIKFSGAELLSPLEKFITAITGTNDTIAVGVMAHFIWGIKRKLLGLDTVFQIMPIILGKQEAGKSYSIEKLLSPIENLKLEMNLNEVIDPRNLLSFDKKFALVINEMAGANKTDVEKLKNLITTKRNDVRKLHTNEVLRARQNTSLIGTTNKPVAEIIYDPTGARRFFEIKSLDKMDWPVIENLDYYALWQGINENRIRGYYEEHKQGINERQAELTGLEELQVFLDLYKIKPGTKEISGILLYETYKTWCETNGVKSILNSVWLSRRLTGKGFKKPYQKSIRGKTTQMYTISEEALELHGKSSYDPLAKEYN
jgi:Virulence-associated protein E